MVYHHGGRSDAEADVAGDIDSHVIKQLKKFNDEAVEIVKKGALLH
jgi:hypothetical protein